MNLRMEQTLERIRQARALFGLDLQPPANVAALKHLREECARRFGLRVPERYCHLLSIADGVEMNGVLFYSSTAPSVDDPDRVLPGVLEQTAAWWPRRKKLMLGNIEDRVFFYDQELDEYQVFDLGEAEPYRRFREFDELFAYAFENRFPEHDPALPPPPWENAS